jgi:hypothetical protein
VPTGSCRNQRGSNVDQRLEPGCLPDGLESRAPIVQLSGRAPRQRQQPLALCDGPTAVQERLLVSRHRCLRFGVDRTGISGLLSPDIGRGDQAGALPQLKAGGDIAARIEQPTRHGDRSAIVFGVQQVLSPHDDAGAASKEDAIRIHRKCPHVSAGAHSLRFSARAGLSVASLADRQLGADSYLFAHPRNNKSN